MNPPDDGAALVKKAPRRPQGDRRRLLAIAGIIIAGAAAAGVMFDRAHRHGGPPPEAARRAPGLPSVLVAPVKREDLVRQIEIAAEFHPFQRVDLHAKVTGYIQVMNVDVGDRVKEGDVLAVLEVPELQDELRKARAAVERSKHEAARAEAAYEDAHLAYTRLTGVMKEHPNLVAQQDLDEARAHDETTNAAWVAAEAAIQEAEANVTRLQDTLNYSKIIAPFDGVITERLADTGALVGAGTSAGSQVLVRISQMNPLRLVLPVPESVASTIRIGDPVAVNIQSIHKTFTAHITRISDEIKTDTRTMHVEVDVPNPDLSLAPGMYATVTLTVERHKDALSIPIEAVPNRRNGSVSILVLDRDHKLEQRPITLGMETSTRAEVISGLMENDLVVVGRHGIYRPGERVSPKIISEGELE